MTRDERSDRRDDPPPMLVLGEDRPDVHDTTPEELRRQRQELERARRELKAQAQKAREEAEDQLRRQREEAEARLREERLEAERELARRQRKLDDAERRIVRTERRLRKKAREQGTSIPTLLRGDDPDGDRDGRTRGGRARGGRSGGGFGRSPRTGADAGGSTSPNGLLAGAARRSSRPLPPLPRMLLLAAAASGLVVAGAVTSLDPPTTAEVDAFVASDEAFAGWLRAGAALDEEVTSYLASGEAQTDPLSSVELAGGAHAAAPGPYRPDSYLEAFEESMAPLLLSAGSNPQRVLSTWQETRDRAGYAVSAFEVGEARDALDRDRVWPTLLLLGAVLAVGGLVWVLVRGGSPVGAGLALLALVPAALVLTEQGRHLDVEPGIEAHDLHLRGAGGARDLVGRDLAVVLGTRNLDSWESEDYWTDRRPDGDEGISDADALAAYLSARGELADIDLLTLTVAESAALGQQLVGPGTALLESALADVEGARAQIVEHTEVEIDTRRYVLLTGAAALLPLAALVPALLRRREVQG